MHEIELVLLLLVAVTGVVTLARRIRVPYPILLVIGGVILAPIADALDVRIELEPELVFLLFLPPILFAAAYFTSWRDFRDNARTIGLLASGLVVLTAAVVAVVSRALAPELTWAAALALGAIVSPPDAIAATAIARRLGVPRRIVVILEGESLVNDAMALVLFRTAVVAAVTGAFTPIDLVVGLPVVAAGGIVVGLVVGWILTEAWRRLDDPPVEIALSMLAPFAAYLPAEQLGVSGVLAAVTAGLVAGRRESRVLASESRVLGFGAWQMLLFVVNGLVFLLIGLQLPTVLGELAERSPVELAFLAIVVSATVIAVRFGWVFATSLVPRRMLDKVDAGQPEPRAHSVVIAYAGLRGVVSLAAALALPRLTEAGEPFPGRDLILFLTFAVILVTLVGQGLTLPWLIGRLHLGEAGEAEAHEETHAREAAIRAARDRIAELTGEFPDHVPLIDQLRQAYDHRAEHLLPHDHDEATTGEVEEAGPDTEAPPESAGPRDEAERELLEHRLIRRAVIDAEREAVTELRDAGVIGDEVMRRIQRELDLEELRMEA